MLSSSFITSSSFSIRLLCTSPVVALALSLICSVFFCQHLYFLRIIFPLAKLCLTCFSSQHSFSALLDVRNIFLFHLVVATTTTTNTSLSTFCDATFVIAISTSSIATSSTTTSSSFPHYFSSLFLDMS